MKLASLKSPSSRDGALCIVNKKLTAAVLVPQIAGTMQQALDNWSVVESQLQQVYQQLNVGAVEGAFPFAADQCAAPLPRAYQWADGSAYVNHVELVRKARGVELPANFWTDPLMYQGCSDSFMGPCDPILAADEAYGIDFEAEIAIITDDVPMACNHRQAEQHIKLFALVNDVSLRNLIPDELTKGFGFFQSKPASSFSPVVITPDEFGSSWDGKRVHLNLLSTLNNQLFGQPNAGMDMTFSFPELIQHAAKTRTLCAGTIIGSGTVSNLDRSKGSSCIAEKRMLELIQTGKPQTSFMSFGDTIRIEMFDSQGINLFGAINQTIAKYTVES